MYRAESQACRQRRSLMIPTALPRFDRPLAKVWPPSFAVSSLKEVPSYQPKVLVFRPDAPHAAAEVFSQGWATMSQVQTANSSPAKAKGEWVEVETEFEDRSILCVDCGEEFIWTAGEQLFFHDKGLRNEPKRCKPCKQAKNERLAAIAAAQATGVRQRIEVTVLCAQCGQQTTVPFYPSQGRPVFCRSCFLGGRDGGGEE